MGRGRYSDATLTLSDAPPPKSSNGTSGSGSGSGGSSNVAKIKSTSRNSGGIAKRSKDPSKKAVQLLLQQTKGSTRRQIDAAKWRKCFPHAREKKVGAKNATSNERVSRKRRPDPPPRKRQSEISTGREMPSTSARGRAETKSPKPTRLRDKKRLSLPVLNIADPVTNDCNAVNRMKFFSHKPKKCDDSNNTNLMAMSPFAYTASLIEGHSSASVCAVCGNGDDLSFSCTRCPLSFHKSCIYPHLQTNDPTPNHCRACSSSFTTSADQDIAKPRVLGLRRLTEEACNGNPIDFVLHPSLQIAFAKRYQSDWLRCSKCQKLRMVPMSCLSECVQTPFECSSAFWTSEQISCASPQPTQHKATNKAVNALVKARSRRRARLFYSGFGDKHRELFGYEPLDIVAVKNEDKFPYRKNPLRSIHRQIVKPPRPRAIHSHSNPQDRLCIQPPPLPERKNGTSPPTRVPVVHPNRDALRPLAANTSGQRITSRPPVVCPTQPRESSSETVDKEQAEELILSRIGELQNLGPLEDILVDLAMTGNREMMRLYKAFWHCPSRFNRQAIRLATFFFQRQNKARATAPQRPKPPNRPQSLPAPTSSIQKPPTVREHRLPAPERDQLHERFRGIRLRQIAEFVRLGQAMYKEMQNTNLDDVPKTHRSHAMAKRMMEDQHNKQIQKLVQAAHSHATSSPQAQQSQPNRQNTQARERRFS